MIELGGNIKLSGFDNIDHAKLIVVKKMIGNYAKKIADDIGNPKELLLTLKSFENSTWLLEASLLTENQKHTSKNSGNNLFFTMNSVLNDIIAKSKE